MSRSTNLIELDDYAIAAETDRAVGLWDGETDEDGRKVLTFLPKSLVTVEDGVVSCPEWLAMEKGLI